MSLFENNCVLYEIMYKTHTDALAIAMRAQISEDDNDPRNVAANSHKDRTKGRRRTRVRRLQSAQICKVVHASKALAGN